MKKTFDRQGLETCLVLLPEARGKRGQTREQDDTRERAKGKRQRERVCRGLWIERDEDDEMRRR